MVHRKKMLNISGSLILTVRCLHNWVITICNKTSDIVHFQPRPFLGLYPPDNLVVHVSWFASSLKILSWFTQWINFSVITLIVWGALHLSWFHLTCLSFLFMNIGTWADWPTDQYVLVFYWWTHWYSSWLTHRSICFSFLLMNTLKRLYYWWTHWYSSWLNNRSIWCNFLLMNTLVLEQIEQQINML